MCSHEIKTCERCHAGFECKPGSVTQCQCSAVMLTTEQRAYLEQYYTDCLCRSCLLQLQADFELFKEKFIYK
jgi:hypothetical protein